jgi:hypothetical protein
MQITRGFDHAATLTADLDRLVRSDQDAFDATVSFETAARDLFVRDIDGMELELVCPGDA